ncbi:inositol monophosphatase family protein [Patescibacteria group bacterium]
MSITEDKLQALATEVESLLAELGEYALAKQSQASVAVKKKGADFATDVDLEVEKKIKTEVQTFSEKFPVFSEEEGKQPESGIYWVVDPIDGTKNYFKGWPLWAINMALYDSGQNELLLAGVFFPAWDDYFAAIKGKGARLNGKNMKLSATRDLVEATLSVALPVPGTSGVYINRLQMLLQRTFRVREWGLAASICYVANGTFDADLNLRGSTNLYDVAAPMLIVAEAGCEIRNFDPANLTGNEIVTNAKLKLPF